MQEQPKENSSKEEQYFTDEMHKNIFVFPEYFGSAQKSTINSGTFPKMYSKSSASRKQYYGK